VVEVLCCKDLLLLANSSKEGGIEDSSKLLELLGVSLGINKDIINSILIDFNSYSSKYYSREQSY
jgi:hypothetical protein